MKDIYKRVLEVLGKPQDDPAFTQFVSDMGEQPRVIAKTAHGSSYLFRESGVQMSYYEHNKCFASAFFHLGSAMAQSGNVSRFTGELPGGIGLGDSRDEAERKLELKPVSSRRIQGRTPDAPKDLWEDYDFLPFRVTLIFRGDNDTLNSVSVHWAPAEVAA